MSAPFDPFDFYTPVAPTPRERAAFRDAERIARDLGVSFRSGEVEVRWWHRESHEVFGFVVRTDTKPVPLWLGTGGDVEQLISTAGHELKHARDHLDGFSLLKPEAEARAQAFAERLLARWLAQQPRPISSPSPQPRATARADQRRPRMIGATVPLDIAALPHLAARAVGRVDLCKLQQPRRISTSRRGFGDYRGLSEAAIVNLTVAVAVLDELLAREDMEDHEAQAFLDSRDQLAARLESEQ